MANTIAVSVIGDVKDINRKLGQVDQKLSGFGKATKRIGGLIGAAFAGGVAVQGIKKMITSASDLNETISKTTTIFGKSAPAILKWGDQAAKSLGLSKQEALDGISTFGNYFNQIGLGAKETEKLSKGFVQASVDLGSFHNAAPTEVMDALSAATRGEYDSLQKFIPTINAARVQAEAMRATGKKAAKELTDQDKARAVSTLVMKGQGKAQGDFARTSKSLANQQKILKAQFDNIVASLGQKLLPIAVKVANILTTKVGPAFQKVAKFIKDNQTTIKVLVGVVAALFAVQKAHAAFMAVQAAGGFLKYLQATKLVSAFTKTWAAVQWLLNAAMAANPVTLIVLAIIALIAVIVLIATKTQFFQKAWAVAWNAIKAVTSAVFGAIKAVIVGAFKFIRAVITTYIKVYVTVIKTAWNVIKNVTSAVWNGVKAVVGRVVKAVVGVIRAQFTLAKTIVKGAWTAVKTATQNIWNGLKTIVSNAVGKVMGVVRGIKDKVQGAFTNAVGWLKSAGKNILQGLINGVTSLAGTLKEKAKQIAQDAIDAVKGVFHINSPSRVFHEIGVYVGQGLINGLNAQGSKVTTAGSAMARNVEKGFSAPELALNTTGGGSGGNNYYVTVQAGMVLDNPVAFGKKLKEAIKAAEGSGAR